MSKKKSVESRRLSSMAPRKRTDRPEAASRPTAIRSTISRGSRCILCGRTTSSERMIPVDSYASPQLTLLYYDLAARIPDLQPSSLASLSCLEKAERSLQKRQLKRRKGELHYVDLVFDRGTILPTREKLDVPRRLTGKGTTIAFVDSGFAPHPDLILPVNRVVGAYNAISGKEVIDFEGDFSEGPPVSAWHGTMAAAVAAGSGHLSGGYYRGIASDARLVLVKAMTPEGRIRTPQVRRALRWVLENHERLSIDVVNLSLGVDEQTRSLSHPVIALVEELVKRGVNVVAAAGNNPERPLVPPGSAPSAITVGGYNDNNSLELDAREAWHSSYGEGPGGVRKPELLGPAIYVAAPILLGTGVKSEAEALFYLAGSSDRRLMADIPLLAPETSIASDLMASSRALHARALILEKIRAEKLITAAYKHVDGTSFAAPIVSSIIATLLQSEPTLTPQQIRARLTSTARKIPKVPADLQGYGAVRFPR